ncbi:predicted protein [Postia placenta Mad-698-R]|nr:predicted protein [Postia placenta Mad-698-R]
MYLSEKLLPQDALIFQDLDGYFYTRIWTLVRPLVASDLVAIEKYAPLVRHLGVKEKGRFSRFTHSYRLDAVTSDALSHIVERYPHPLLFPGILSLDWRVVMRPWSHSAISDRGSWKDLLVYVGPKLRELYLGKKAYAPHKSDTLSGLAEVLDAVGNQFIQELQLGLGDQWKPWARPVSGQPLQLSSLTTIEIVEASAESYINFARFVSLPQVKSATLCITPYPSAAHLGDLFSAIGQQFCPDRLVNLSVHLLEFEPSNEVAHGAIAHSDYLRSLLPFCQMQRIVIDADWEYGHDDEVLQEMAKAWPGLKHLEFAEAEIQVSRSHLHSPATLRSLIPLATCCKDLLSLGIWLHVDIRADHEAIVADIAQAMLNPSSSPLAILKVSHSTIEGLPEDIASLLSILFPDLQEIIATGADEHVERWGKVEKLLLAARNARLMEL